MAGSFLASLVLILVLSVPAHAQVDNANYNRDPSPNGERVRQQQPPPGSLPRERTIPERLGIPLVYYYCLVLILLSVVVRLFIYHVLGPIFRWMGFKDE